MCSKVFVTLGFSPFSVSFDFTLVNVKLLDFSLKPDCTPPPPKLATPVGRVLYVNSGKLGTAAVRGDKAWEANGADETIVVRQKGDGSMAVANLGITQDYPAPVDTVVLDARGYTGKLSLLLQGEKPKQPFSAKAVVFGGSNDDTFRTGSGSSFVVRRWRGRQRHHLHRRPAGSDGRPGERSERHRRRRPWERHHHHGQRR